MTPPPAHRMLLEMSEAIICVRLTTMRNYLKSGNNDRFLFVAQATVDNLVHDGCNTDISAEDTNNIIESIDMAIFSIFLDTASAMSHIQDAYSILKHHEMPSSCMARRLLKSEVNNADSIGSFTHLPALASYMIANFIIN